MQLLKQFFRFYILANIHVAIGTFCLVKITLLPYNSMENNTALFVFFSTIVSYNFIRFYRIKDASSWFLNWFNMHKKLLFSLTVTSIFALLILVFQMQLKALLWLFPFAVFTLFYGLPLPFKGVSLRNIPGMKLFLIAISFAGITVLFPLVQNNIEIGLNEWIAFLQRFFFIILITIPFDIRDLHYDKIALKTVPQIVGIKKTKMIGILAGLLFVLLAFFKQPINEKQIILLFVVSIVSVLFLINSKEKQSNYYSAFWVEALPIFWFLLTLLKLNM